MTISYSTSTATTNPIKFYWGLADFSGDVKHVIDFFAIEHLTYFAPASATYAEHPWHNGMFRIDLYHDP